LVVAAELAGAACEEVWSIEAELRSDALEVGALDEDVSEADALAMEALEASMADEELDDCASAPVASMAVMAVPAISRRIMLFLHWGARGGCRLRGANVRT